MADTITATIRYVSLDKSPTTITTTEKPYILHYLAPSGFPQNNFTIKPVHNLPIHNLRTVTDVTYQTHGMTIATLDSEFTNSNQSISPSDFDNDDWVERVYLPQLHRTITRALGAQDVTIFDWMVRKRAPSFPVRKEGEENEGDHQPSLSAHIDYTTAELESRLDRYFGDEKEEMLRRRYQVINIWKPLTGPCRDFPMAYLDPTTVDRQKDLIAVDEVFPTVANEVYQVRWNPNHKWYYVPDQLDSEVAIFNAFDSERGQALAVPHCSFDLAEAGSGIPRQSIEVRAFVFY